jgi:hypothetical protein
VEAPGFSASLALDRDPDKNPLTALRCFRTSSRQSASTFLKGPIVIRIAGVFACRPQSCIEYSVSANLSQLRMDADDVALFS